FRKGDPDPQAALARADQATYQAKARGKNQVCREDEVEGQTCPAQQSELNSGRRS
ncbi:MAG: hypothetical protein JRJ59_11915, partial [Deltaproteobacteria bacterium]|nr:hypothetical protein [Deltaproteobacteria bacterium]